MQSSRPPRSKRALTVTSPCIEIRALRDTRAMVPGEITRGTLHFSGPDGALLLTVDYEADLRGPDRWIELQHCRPGEPPEPSYRIAVREAPSPCGGKWRFICPARGVFSAAVYCPASATRFASSQGHGMRVPSDSDASHLRPLRRLQRLQARFEAWPGLVPKGGYRGAHGAQKATLARLRAQIAEAELRTWQAAAGRPRRAGDTREE